MTAERLAILALLAFGIAACGSVGGPRTVGSCRLAVLAEFDQDAAVLEPPYEATLFRRPGGATEAWITLHGTGWGRTQVDMVGPGKTVSATVEAENMNGPSAWVATAPGTWHFAVTSGPCTGVFDVEVKPAP